MALSVADQLEIQQLYANYNHAIDFGRGAEWAATFTPDGVFNSGQGTFTGTEQLQGFVAGFAAQLKARHWTNNLVVDGDGAKASGACYLLLWRLQAGAAPSVLVSGVYHDELAKTADGWRFTSRRVAPDAV
ncbi:MAG: nuclear transport factor 2 family protein [Dehalococcoidia bacterium]